MPAPYQVTTSTSNTAIDYATQQRIVTLCDGSMLVSYYDGSTAVKLVQITNPSSTSPTMTTLSQTFTKTTPSNLVGSLYVSNTGTTSSDVWLVYGDNTTTTPIIVAHGTYTPANGTPWAWDNTGTNVVASTSFVVPAIVWTGTNLIVISRITGYQIGLYYTTTKNGSSGWSAAAQLSSTTSGSSHYFPCLLHDGTNNCTIAVYSLQADHVVARVLADSAASPAVANWSGEVTLSTATNIGVGAANISATIDPANKNLHVTWCNSLLSPNPVYSLSTYTTTSITAGTPFTITGGGGTGATSPSIGLDGGSPTAAYIFWASAASGAASDISYVKISSPYGSGNVSSVTNLTNASTNDNVFPQIPHQDPFSIFVPLVYLRTATSPYAIEFDNTVAAGRSPNVTVSDSATGLDSPPIYDAGALTESVSVPYVNGTGIGDLSVSTVTQTWVNSGSGPETRIIYTDQNTNSGWGVGIVPSYGGATIAPWYEINRNAILGAGTLNAGGSQTSLYTVQSGGATNPDGWTHMLEESASITYNGGFDGSEYFSFAGAGSLTEQAPTGTAFRRYYKALVNDGNATPTGLKITTWSCIYPGDPGMIVDRIDWTNPTGSAITLQQMNLTSIGGLVSSNAVPAGAWHNTNAFQNTVGGTAAAIPSSATSGEPDYVYVTPTNTYGQTIGIMAVKGTVLGATGYNWTPSIHYDETALGNASDRLKILYQTGGSYSIPANTTQSYYVLKVLRRNLTATDANAIAADYLNPGTPTVTVGSAVTQTSNTPVGRTATNFNWDERAWVFSASSNRMYATLDMSPAAVSVRYKPVIKILNWTATGAPVLFWGGSALSSGVDFRYYNDTANQILYVQLYFDVVASGATTGQKNNAVLGVRQSYDALVLSESGLMAYYPLSEASGSTTITDLVNSYTGTVASGTTLGATSLLTGDASTGVSFNGTTGHITLDSRLNPANLQAFTVECWLSLNSQGTWSTFIANEHTDSTGLGFTCEDRQGGFPNGLGVTVGGTVNGLNYSGSAAAGTASMVQNSTVYHYVAIYDGGSVRVFINGTQQGAQTAVYGGIRPSTYPIALGYNPATSGDYFNGTLQKVAFYNKVLSVRSIRSHYIAGSTSATPGSYSSTVLSDSPTRYYRLNDASGATTAVDAGTNNVTATVNASASAKFGLTGMLQNDTGTMLGLGTSNSTVTTSTATTTGLPTGASPWTMECWMTTHQQTNWYTPLNFGTYGNTRQSPMLFVSSGGITLGTFNDDGASYNLSLDIPHHVVGTYDGATTIKLYVDGTLVNTHTLGAALNVTFTGTYSMAIGCTTANSLPFTSGNIQEVAIYTTALSASRVLAHYQAGIYTPAPSTYTKTTYDSIITGENGLVAYYPLSETGGSIVSDVYGGNDGYLYGGSYSANTSIISQDSGTCKKFDGLTGGVYTYLTPVGWSAFTLESWVQFSAVTSAQVIVGTGDPNDTASGFTLLYDPVNTYYTGTASRLCTMESGRSAFAGSQGIKLEVNTPYHVVTTWDGATLSVYVNGAIQSQTQSFSARVAVSHGICFGSNVDTHGQPVNGSLQKVAIYNSALTTKQIQRHYLAGAPVATNTYSTTTPTNTYYASVMALSPVRYYRLGDTVGAATAVDSSSNAVAGTVNSTSHVTFGGTGITTVADSNTSAYFDGSGVITETSTTGLPTTGPMTIEAWFNTDNSTANAGNGIGGNIGNSGSTRQSLGILARVNKPAYFGIFTWGDDTNTYPAANSTWTHVVGVYDGATKLSFYMNGMHIEDHTLGGTVTVTYTAPAALEIGSATNGNLGYSYHGSIDEFAIYNVALTASQVQEHYIAGLSAGLTDAATGSEVISAGKLQATEALTDSLAGTDTISSVKVTGSVTDSATGADNITSLNITSGIADSATGVDSPTVTSPVPVSDSATGTDGVTVSGGSTGIPVSDSATGSDTPALQVNTASTDSATGSDTPTLGTVTPAASDSATGNDAPALQVNTAQTDSGAGSDAPSLGTITSAVPDSGSGSDGISTAILFALSDGASLTDSLSIAPVAVPVSDNATVAESLSVGITLSSITDPATGAESVSLSSSSTLSISDNATGSDQPSISTQIPQSDSGAGSDVLALGTVTFPLSDTALAAESLSVQVSTIQVPSDAATGSDTPQIAALFTLVDAGTGAEIQSVAIQPFSISDTANGVETMYLFRMLTVTDAGTAQDTIRVRTQAPVEILAIVVVAPSATITFESPSGTYTAYTPEGNITFTVE